MRASLFSRDRVGMACALHSHEAQIHFDQWCDMKKRVLFLIAMAAGFLLPIAAELQARENHKCVISTTGMGPIRLGMTLREAKAAIADASFQRSTDGDGAALVSVLIGKEHLMTLHADEVDPERPIDWTRKIDFVETFNPSCKTADGIFPGMPARNAEKKLGKTTKIIQSEIESREFIYFQNQPKNFLFRLDYSGRFPEGARKTKKFSEGAKILSIGVSRHQ